jgi:ADP-heptose:LPS heptosyltransferase
MDPIQKRKVYFLGANRLGDFLCTTAVIRGFRTQNPDAHITYIVHDAPYTRLLESNPDIDCIVYDKNLKVDASLRDYLPEGLEADSPLYCFDIHRVCDSSYNVFRDHITRGFAKDLQIRLESVRPVITLAEEDYADARHFTKKPYIVLAMHTGSTVIASDLRLVLKDWIVEYWLRLAQQIPSLGDFDIIAIGSNADVPIRSRFFRNLYGLPIKTIAAICEKAACVISVENGISHLCHAVDAPMVLLYSRYVSFPWAYPREAGNCHVIYKDPVLISPEEVYAALKSILSSVAVAI